MVVAQSVRLGASLAIASCGPMPLCIAIMTALGCCVMSVLAALSALNDFVQIQIRSGGESVALCGCHVSAVFDAFWVTK